MFQVNILSREFQNALKKLNDCFKEENMKSLFHIQEKSKGETNSLGETDRLQENDILVGIGLHIIQKLAGEAATSPAKCKTDCPCGCLDLLKSNKDMYIGNTIFRSLLSR